MSTTPSRSAPPPPPPEEDSQGASANERLLAAAKTDNEGMLEDALKELSDINQPDGLGNTALHYAIIHASTNVLELILCHDTCDVDLKNRLQGDTPLHIAVRNRWDQYEGLRLWLVQSLLEAGADTTIRNRYNEKPIDILPRADPNADLTSDDEKIRCALRQAEAEASLAISDAVVDDDDEAEVDPDDVASDSD
ncbi:hypothetical protein CNBC0280 [Cryptococcus deneoformans B-3501A]|uniref:Uncharacterized protein n=1 Tax=Cryptococcus deneoformans (strain JEC21 / ATCC MYA-565) TaxID=214684 RepID=Q5KJD8_CRYD1|nr:hypothetical protein CNC06890 [Cryptococcus neoformans var. neoformans JEC21]XP_776534.1 hypothetical protein CNBC0280 [Cryptococcus neoformans var. neoformans B-3501A]AAW42624.2 hypothetical protein CNC06890 [Cryptococcus neoformans var. neoformans JEC21]EAL21887.1 hypothetical protein CNBC0280 [Cryptococcus neoformans var. neoformans B-3501A]